MLNIWRKRKRNRGPNRSLEVLENRHLLTIDLVPTIVDAPDVASTEETILVRTEVGNRGTTSSGDYSVQYRLSLDNAIDSQDRVIMTLSQSSIPASDRQRWEQPIPIPEGVPQGVFYIGVTIDHTNQVLETDKTNNQLIGDDPIRLLKGLPRLTECDTLGHEGTTYQTGVNCRTMNLDGYPRTFIVYVPEGVVDSPNAVSLVTMFHGSSGHGNRHFKISGWREKSDEVGLVTVFPTSAQYCEIGAPCENGKLSGWTTKWNNRGFIDQPDFNFEVAPPSYPDDAPWPPDDDGFVAAMWDDVEALLPIDSGRTYATGFSNGGGRTRQVSLDMPDRLAAAAYVGTLGIGSDPDTAPEDPIPLYAILGTDDSKILEALGLEPHEELPLQPADVIANSNLQSYITQTLDLLQLSYDASDLQPDASTADAISSRLTWNQPIPENSAGNSFHLSIWKDLVHHYPFRQSADKNPHGFVAVDTFWEFFQQHSKSGELSADLKPTQIVAPAIGSLDEPFSLRMQVANQGQMASGEYAVQLRISLDPTIDSTDRVIMNLSRSSIAPGHFDDWEQMVVIPDTAPQGRFFFGATVDPDDEIAEVDESNNSLMSADSVELYKGLPLSECETFGPAGTDYSAGVNCRTVDVDGYPRTYIIYVPNDVLESGKGPVPSVTMFHGGSGHGKKFLNISGWREKADEEGFIAAFPTSAMYCEVGTPCENGRLSGWTTRWNHLTLEDAPIVNFDQKPPGYPSDATWPADDVQFMGAMFDDMETMLPVDSYRNYVSGFSSGAQFGRILLYELPERIAAVAIVAGGLEASRDPDFDPPEIVPLYLAVGDQDEKVLDTFGLATSDRIPLDPNQILGIMGDTMIDGTLETLNLVYDPNNLVPDQVQGDAKTTRLTWNTPIDEEMSTEFHLTVWSELAHVYPAQPSASKNPNGFSAADTFWQFFASHSKRVPGDSNRDGRFDSKDLIQVFVAGEYEDGIDGNSTFAEGDWNGDNDFDSGDLVYAFQAGTYVPAAKPESLVTLALGTLLDDARFQNGLKRLDAKWIEMAFDESLDFGAI